jgi:hypothetical protein
MAAPILEIRTSLQVSTVGVPFTYQPAALNTPTSWTALYLPTGLSINSSTGAITGTPTTEGFWQTVLQATNVDGSDRIVLLMPVLPAVNLNDAIPGMGGPFDILLDYELTSNEVTIPGVPAPADGAPLFYAPRGTNRFLLVGVKYYGVLQDLNADDEPIEIKLGMKEVEPESLLEVTTSATTKVAGVTDDQQRYRIPFRVTPSNWGVLGDYEADAATIISALAELQVSVGTVATLHDATLTDSSIALEGNVTTPITGDHDFLSIDEFSVATPMRLTLTLSVASRPLQTVTLVREFDLIFSGGVFVLSNLSGSTTGTGAVEGDQWRATLNLTALTGDANSVDADYSITTSADTTIPYSYVELSGSSDGLFLSDPGDGEASQLTISSDIVLELWPGNDEYTDIIIGTFVPSNTYDNAAAFAAALLAGWETASGANDVVSVTYDIDTLTFRINLESGSAVTHIKWGDSGATFRAVTQSSVIGTATTCSVAATLEQLEDPTAVPLNLTSNQFRIGVARDIVPD